MSQPCKTNTLHLVLWASVAILALLTLASSFPRFELLNGDFSLLVDLLKHLLRNFFTEQETHQGFRLGNERFLAHILAAILLLMLIVLPFGLVLFIVSPEFRQRLLKQLKFLVTFLAIFYMLTRFRIIRSLQEFVRQGLAADPDASSEVKRVLQALNDLTSAPPERLLVLSNFILALCVAVSIAGIIWWGAHLRSRRYTIVTEVEGIAQETVRAVRTGQDFCSSILRCYADMSRAIQIHQHIQRPQTMTAREFETRLKQTGLPQDAVHYLTHTFEEVRYGAKHPDPEEEQQTLVWLAQIIAACQRLAFQNAGVEN